MYRDIDGFEQKKETDAKRIKELAREKSILSGEIKELEKSKGTLLGEIDNSIISTCQKIEAMGQEADLKLNEQVSNIRNELDNLMIDTINAGAAIGEMRQMVNKGEDSEKSLKRFIRETRERLEAN